MCSTSRDHDIVLSFHDLCTSLPWLGLVPYDIITRFHCITQLMINNLQLIIYNANTSVIIQVCHVVGTSYNLLQCSSRHELIMNHYHVQQRCAKIPGSEQCSNQRLPVLPLSIPVSSIACRDICSDRVS